MRPPAYRFEMTVEAARHNWSLLERHRGYLGDALREESGTPMEIGSEFRPPKALQALIGNHPLWPRINSILTVGSLWDVAPISEDLRVASVEAHLERGNHKSAEERPAILRDLLIEDVVHGFTLPVPASSILSIPGAEVAPMGIAAQSTINEIGEIIDKDRLTHDLSFQIADAGSVNDRCDMNLHQECLFGHVLRRCIVYIVDVRRRHPHVIFNVKITTSQPRKYES